MNHGQPTETPNRIRLLDILRGIALFGILFPNIFWVASIYIPKTPEFLHTWAIRNFVFDGRFYSIFAVLFGVGCYILAKNAERKNIAPRPLIVRRLLWLLVLGISHQIFIPGEALFFFTVFGLPLALLYDFLPRFLLLLSLALLIAGVPAMGLLMVPGLICLGLYLGRVGYFQDFARFKRATIITWVISLILFPWLCYQQYQQWPAIHIGTYQRLAGLTMGTFLVTSIILLPKSEQILKLFAAPGRMALTNYISQTVIILLVDYIRPIQAPDVIGIWLAIGTLQILFSNIWLNFFSMGPLEWLWRWATYGKPSQFFKPMRLQDSIL